MDEYLEKLRRLYLTVPVFGQGTARDLRKAFDEYISIFVNVSIIEDYKNSTYELNEGVEDIDILISGTIEAKTNSDKEMLFIGASNELKKDIKSLISIIESNPKNN